MMRKTYIGILLVLLFGAQGVFTPERSRAGKSKSLNAKVCSRQLTKSSEIIRGKEKSHLLAHHMGLKVGSDSRRGYIRKKKGKGYAYYDTRDRLITNEKVKLRIETLRIPPAWTDVWISPDPKNYLQVTGKDSKGRKQPIYHHLYLKAGAEYKFNSTIRFAHALSDIRKKARFDIGTIGLNEDKVLAGIVFLLDETLIRIGTDSKLMKYKADKEAFGLTTLLRKHLTIKGETLIFNFFGKKGVHHNFDITIDDSDLLKLLINLKNLRRGPLSIRRQLFKYVDDSGQFQAIRSSQVNEYIGEASGNGFTAKNFRTWRATVMAAQVLAEWPPAESLPQRKRDLAKAMKVVADKLHNTPTVARNSYVHPEIIIAYRDEGFDFSNIFGRRGRPSIGLSKDEKAVLDWLEER